MSSKCSACALCFVKMFYIALFRLQNFTGQSAQQLRTGLREKISKNPTHKRTVRKPNLDFSEWTVEIVRNLQICSVHECWRWQHIWLCTRWMTVLSHHVVSFCHMINVREIDNAPDAYTEHKLRSPPSMLHQLFCTKCHIIKLPNIPGYDMYKHNINTVPTLRFLRKPRLNVLSMVRYWVWLRTVEMMITVLSWPWNSSTEPTFTDSWPLPRSALRIRRTCGPQPDIFMDRIIQQHLAR